MEVPALYDNPMLGMRAAPDKDRDPSFSDNIAPDDNQALTRRAARARWKNSPKIATAQSIAAASTSRWVTSRNRGETSAARPFLSRCALRSTTDSLGMETKTM